MLAELNNKEAKQLATKEQTQKHFYKVILPRWKENVNYLLESKDNKCADCGMRATFDNFIVFDMHHLDETKKKFNLDSNKLKLRMTPEIKEEINKCVLLCACCHRLRHNTRK